MSDTITFRVGPEDVEAIEAEQARLAAQGVKINKSQAVRSLISRASSITDEANGEPKVVVSEVFKEK